jgi:predicted nuclease of predicted toxin-antitoxin system
VLAFHLDEHIDPAIAFGLRRRGIDCTTTADAALLGADDTAHVEFALREGRVVVTNDADFLALATEGLSHAGIAYFQNSSRTIGHVIRHLCLMSDCLEPEEITGKVEFL